MQLKQRGRKNYTEKTSVSTFIETGQGSNSSGDLSRADSKLSEREGNHRNDDDSPLGKPLDESCSTAVTKKAKSSLHFKVICALCFFGLLSAGSLVFLYIRKQSRDGQSSYKSAAYFDTRKSKRTRENAFLARSRPDINERADDENVLFGANGGGYVDDADEDNGYFVDTDGHKHNLGSFLAPLLRGALLENNKANLGIASDQFVHGNDDDSPANSKNEKINPKRIDRSDDSVSKNDATENSGSSVDEGLDDEESDEVELLQKLENEFANKDVPLRSDLGQVTKMRQKLADRLRLAREPKVKVIDDINATEFYIAVGQSEPVLVKNASQWCTKGHWTLDFIKEKAGDSVVGIETSKSNRFYSNEGLRKKQMKVRDFLDVFANPNRTMDYYLAEEGIEKMPALEADLNIDQMDFANFAVLDRKQLWVGAGGQVSPLHHDQWDNILCQIQGRRTFVLYDPLQVDRLYPKSGAERHFSQVDASNPDHDKFPKFKFARQYRVDVEAGQMIILPAYWWHQVHHGPDINIGVNYWFVPASLMTELLYDLMLPDGPNY